MRTLLGPFCLCVLPSAFNLCLRMFKFLVLTTSRKLFLYFPCKVETLVGDQRVCFFKYKTSRCLTSLQSLRPGSSGKMLSGFMEVLNSSSNVIKK